MVVLGKFGHSSKKWSTIKIEFLYWRKRRKNRGYWVIPNSEAMKKSDGEEDEAPSLASVSTFHGHPPLFLGDGAMEMMKKSILALSSSLGSIFVLLFFFVCALLLYEEE